MNEVRKMIVHAARSEVGRIKYCSYRGPLQEQSPVQGLRCDNFVIHVYRQAGISVPDFGCWELYGHLPAISEPLPGDLVFRNGRQDGKPGHVGIYAGGSAIHLPKSAGTVVETGIEWFDPLMGFRSVKDFIGV